MTTPIIEGREVIGCNVCGLRLNPGDAGHEKDIDCIKAFRIAYKKQHDAASRLALDISTQWFSIIEGLAQDPECGVQYYHHNVETGEKKKLGHSEVRGVMAAIFRKVQEQGNWSTMENIRKELGEERKLNLRFQDVLAEIEKQWTTMPFDLKLKVRGLLYPEGLHLEADGPQEE